MKGCRAPNKGFVWLAATGEVARGRCNCSEQGQPVKSVHDEGEGNLLEAKCSCRRNARDDKGVTSSNNGSINVNAASADARCKKWKLVRCGKEIEIIQLL